jgi:hypothetical protein
MTELDSGAFPSTLLYLYRVMVEISVGPSNATLLGVAREIEVCLVIDVGHMNLDWPSALGCWGPKGLASQTPCGVEASQSHQCVVASRSPEGAGASWFLSETVASRSASADVALQLPDGTEASCMLRSAVES